MCRLLNRGGWLKTVRKGVASIVGVEVAVWHGGSWSSEEQLRTPATHSGLLSRNALRTFIYVLLTGAEGR